MKQITDSLMNDLQALTALLFDFAKINRATYLDDKGTPESDTDHTVMLSVIACALAATHLPELDLGKVAQFALVHDLVEVYAGDVNTIDFHSVDHDKKTASEAAALKKIKQQFGSNLPWIHQTIEDYESLESPEARFVKTLDKAMPGLCHIQSNNLLIDETFDDPETFEASVDARNKHIETTYGHDQGFALEVRKRILKEVIANKFAHHNDEQA